MTLFSRRHRRALASGDLEVQVSHRLAGRLARLLERFDTSWYVQPDPTDNWTERTDALTELVRDLVDVYGGRELTARVGIDRWEPVGALEFVRRTSAPQALDAVEQFATYLGNDAADFASEVNRVLGEEDSVWRLLDLQFVKLDSVFVHEQVVAAAHERLGEAAWEGASDELRAAEHDLVDGAGRGAVHHAGSSLESALKAALAREDGTAAVLAKALRDEGWLDELPESLRDGFIDNVLLSLPWMRNRLGGHGQGRERQPVAQPYARLAVGLAAVLDEFIVNLALERGVVAPTAPLEVPAATLTAGAPDADDIPF
jgi:HEPN domain-containing protein